MKEQGEGSVHYVSCTVSLTFAAFCCNLPLSYPPPPAFLPLGGYSEARLVPSCGQVDGSLPRWSFAAHAWSPLAVRWRVGL